MLQGHLTYLACVATPIHHHDLSPRIPHRPRLCHLDLAMIPSSQADETSRHSVLYESMHIGPLTVR